MGKVSIIKMKCKDLNIQNCYNCNNGLSHCQLDFLAEIIGINNAYFLFKHNFYATEEFSIWLENNIEKMIERFNPKILDDYRKLKLLQ